ncbi:restriction endonuclease [Burkholderia sp. Ac-20384]|uniref:restriction endonuclease n=1 Tax=Burkholderia sp. Ac-20384 TaxID=2703902 RepID=UPI00197DE000|nr:restriction endonuclease [Burkholderia sp. Ac-20384]MBN3826034.1 restriction endonuclease [Burkholderia sp. Ac-20384]
MPARTNDFQKLVRVINRHLAPAGAKVSESAMLHDPEAETEREIDILVESKLLNCDIKIGIECTALGKPVEVRIIEAFREKHRKVGINQTIVVSKNGFTDSAKNYARKNGIKLLTFNSAKSENWKKNFEKLRDLSVYGRRYFVRSITVSFSSKKTTPDFVFDGGIEVAQGDSWISVNQYAANLFLSSEISKHKARELMENEVKGSDPWIEIGFNLGSNVDFRDKDGRLSRPEEIVIVFGYVSNYRSLNSEQVSYDGEPLVVGGFFDGKDGGFAQVAFNEVDGKVVGTLEFDDKFLPDVSKLIAKPGAEARSVK